MFFGVIVIFDIEIAVLIQSFGIPNYIYALTQSTKLYEENYVNPKTAKLTFPEKKRNQYDNVHACSSKQVAAFVNWVKSQPFYENTTIIISGDHLGMQTSYYDEKIGNTNYQRTIYNTFINPAISTSHSKNRQFTTFDMYPSTLAALGVEIDGDRLGLGTNLFSGKKTLVEQYGGIENLNSELSKRSAYYENKIFTKSGN